jgi:hypothetical protein
MGLLTGCHLAPDRQKWVCQHGEMTSTRLVLFSVVLALSGCETMRATGLATPKERVTECETLCSSIGLEMAAVVIIMSNAGCVCEKKRATVAEAGASAVTGGAVIAATAAASRQGQQPVVVR